MVSDGFVANSVQISLFYGGTNGDVYKEVDGLALLASYCEEKILGTNAA